MVIHFNRKIIYLIFILISIVILSLFALSINQVELAPGSWSLTLINLEIQDTGSLDWNQTNLYYLLRFLAPIILWVLLPLSVVYFILSKTARKRILRDTAILSVLLLGFYYLLTYQGQFGNLKNPSLLPTGDNDTGAITDIVTAEPSLWTTYIASFVVALTMVGFAIWLYHRAKAANPPIDQLNLTIDQAIEDIHQTRDIHSVIIRCYVELQRIVEETHGRSRQQSMTPREFYSHLRKYGIHHTSIGKLTSLFEKARYSDFRITNAEENEALSNLKQIQKELNGEGLNT